MSAVAIPAPVAQHTVNLIMVQGKFSNTNFSRIRVYESCDAIRTGRPIIKGTDIIFAPGTFESNTEHGRRLIGDTLVSVLVAARPAARPYRPHVIANQPLNTNTVTNTTVNTDPNPVPSSNSSSAPPMAPSAPGR